MRQNNSTELLATLCLKLKIQMVPPDPKWGIFLDVPGFVSLFLHGFSCICIYRYICQYLPVLSIVSEYFHICL